MSRAQMVLEWRGGAPGYLININACARVAPTAEAPEPGSATAPLLAIAADTEGSAHAIRTEDDLGSPESGAIADARMDVPAVLG